MDYSLFRFKLTDYILLVIIASFSIVTACPAHCVESHCGVGDVLALARIGKLIEKVKKNLEKQNSKEIIQNMLDLKSEAEYFGAIKIDICKSIDMVLNDAKAKGAKISTETEKSLKRLFKHKSKRHAHKSHYMLECIENDIEYDSTVEKALYLQSAGLDLIAKSSKEEEVQLPIKLVVGVTGVLAGMFILLIPLPIPAKNTVAGLLITQGITYTCDSLIEEVEKKK